MNILDDPKENEPWRERLDRHFVTTKLVVKDCFTRIKDNFPDPFGRPVPLLINDKWNRIKEKVANFVISLPKWKENNNFETIRDAVFENVGSIFLGIFSAVALVFGTKKLARIFKGTEPCPLLVAKNIEDMFNVNDCDCDGCTRIKSYKNAMDDFDEKVTYALDFYEELIKANLLDPEQKSHMSTIYDAQVKINKLRKHELRTITKARAEAVASGSFITRKAVNVKLAEMSSGDSITGKSKGTKLAEYSSGSHITGKAANKPLAENYANSVDVARLEKKAMLVNTKLLNYDQDEEEGLGSYKEAERAVMLKLQQDYKNLIMSAPRDEARGRPVKDLAFQEQHLKVVTRNLVLASTRYHDNKGVECEIVVNGVMLMGTVMMVNHHFLRYVERYRKTIYIQHFGRNMETEIRLSDCTIHRMTQRDGKEVDAVLLALPNKLHQYPDITKLFSQASEYERVEEGQRYLTGFRRLHIRTPSGPASTMTVNNIGLVRPRLRKEVLNYYSENKEVEYNLARSLEYEGCTQSGDCGSLIFTRNVSMRGRICGFHVAGDAENGYALPTTHEFIMRNLEIFRQKVNDDRKFIVGPFSATAQLKNAYVNPALSKMEFDLPGDYSSIGVAKKVPVPSKTNLSPSEIFEEIYPTKTKPAHLKPVLVGDKRIDPLLKGVTKSLNIQPNLDLRVLEIASHDVGQMFRKTKHDLRRVLTYEEAIMGVEGYPNISSINRTTSPGYPYVFDVKTSGKRDWLGTTDEWDTTNVELRTNVDKIIENAKNNIRTETLFMCTLKDERRPFAKVDAVKTRVFEAGPMDYTIAVRKYYLGFIDNIMRNKIDNEVCVGINSYSMEWNKLAQHLSKHGQHVIAGDFSNFDGSLLQEILWEIPKIVNDWYDDGEENARIRNVLFAEIANSFSLVNGVIIQKTHSQPSGNPLTVIVNSLFNQIVMRMAYLILKKKRGDPMFCDFKQFVALATYGDDNAANISSKIIEWFNQATITEALATFGLTYTDEAKSGKVVESRRLGDINFLKRSFRLNEDGIYVAPLDIDVVRDMTNWVKGSQIKNATRRNIEGALMEFALHGKEVYAHESKLLAAADAKHDLGVRFPSYAEWDDFYADQRKQ